MLGKTTNRFLLINFQHSSIFYVWSSLSAELVLHFNIYQFSLCVPLCSHFIVGFLFCFNIIIILMITHNTPVHPHTYIHIYIYIHTYIQTHTDTYKHIQTHTNKSKKNTIFYLVDSAYPCYCLLIVCVIISIIKPLWVVAGHILVHYEVWKVLINTNINFNN